MGAKAPFYFKSFIMKSQLLIPDKIRVGYQKRADTYTQKLAYIIYYDKQGKLRKETSFESWRHKDIPVEEFENKPHSGFILNKDVKRSSEWFGNGRNMIRIYDDRGMEFEITTGNLLFILMTTNCHKRGLEGEFVYAWSNKDLVLLPTGCDEYRNSVEFTELKTQNVKKKNLIPGCSYKTKTQEDLIYLGLFEHTDHKIKYLNNGGSERFHFEKKYVFLNATTNNYVALKDIKTLAIQITDIPISNYAELIDAYSKSVYSSKPIGFVYVDKEIQLNADGYIHNPKFSHINHYDNDFFYRKFSDTDVIQYQIRSVRDYSRHTITVPSSPAPIKGYEIFENYRIKLEGGNLIQRYMSRNNPMIYETLDEIKKYGTSDLKILFDNGSTINFDDIKSY